MPKPKTDEKKDKKEKRDKDKKEKRAADSITHYERGIKNITEKVMEK